METVAVRLRTNKLRQLRDLIIREHGGSVHKSKLNIPQNLSRLLDSKGMLHAAKLQEHIDAVPATTYAVSHGEWRDFPASVRAQQREAGYPDVPHQRHSEETSKVFRLHLSPEMVAQLKQRGAWELFQSIHKLSAQSGHPVHPSNPTTIGWVRYTGDDTGIHIDETQSDISGNLTDQMIKQLQDHYGYSPEAAKTKGEEMVPRDALKHILEVAYGGKQPGEVLQEAFHQHLRDTGRVGVPVAIPTPQTKASLTDMDLTKPLPGHMFRTYQEHPEAMGLKPSTYGVLPTQTNPDLADKPMYQDEIRKSEGNGRIMSHPHDYEIWMTILPKPLEKGKKDAMAMYKPEHAGFAEAKDHVNWAYSKMPNENWSLMTVRHHRDNPKDFTPEAKAQLEHFAGMTHVPEIANMRFDKTHDLPKALQALHQAEGMYINRVKGKYKLVRAPPDAKKVLDFGDGTAWWSLGKSVCREEGNAMGHCGNSGSPKPGDNILSLRTEHTLGGVLYHQPHLTFIQNGHILGEMKATGNSRPPADYHDKIVALINQGAGDGHPLLPVGGGYAPENNFKLADLDSERTATLHPDVLGARDSYVALSKFRDGKGDAMHLVHFVKQTTSPQALAEAARDPSASVKLAVLHNVHTPPAVRNDTIQSAVDKYKELTLAYADLGENATPIPYDVAEDLEAVISNISRGGTPELRRNVLDLILGKHYGKTPHPEHMANVQMAGALVVNPETEPEILRALINGVRWTDRMRVNHNGVPAEYVTPREIFAHPNLPDDIVEASAEGALNALELPAQIGKRLYYTDREVELPPEWQVFASPKLPTHLAHKLLNYGRSYYQNQLENRETPHKDAISQALYTMVTGDGPHADEAAKVSAMGWGTNTRLGVDIGSYVDYNFKHHTAFLEGLSKRLDGLGPEIAKLFKERPGSGEAEAHIRSEAYNLTTLAASYNRTWRHVSYVTNFGGNQASLKNISIPPSDEFVPKLVDHFIRLHDLLPASLEWGADNIFWDARSAVMGRLLDSETRASQKLLDIVSKKLDDWKARKQAGNPMVKMSKTEFLEQVLTKAGYQALAKAADKTPVLWKLVVPRTVLGFLSKAQGTIEVPVLGGRLVKSGDTWTGQVGRHPVSNASTAQTAAIVALLLGYEVSDLKAHASHVRRLGKHIDALLDLRKAGKVGGGSKIGYGVAHAPETEGQTPPVGKQKQQMVAKKPFGQKTKPELTKKKKRLPRRSIEVSKAQVSCQNCGGEMFTANRFTGCVCWSDLAKSVTTVEYNDGYVLDLSKLDIEQAQTLMEEFHGHETR